jgi:hypothetical protein
VFEVSGRRFEAGAEDRINVPGAMPTHSSTSPTNPPVCLVMMHGMDAQRFFLGLGQILEHKRPDTNALNMFGKSWVVEFLGSSLSLNRD